MILDFEAAVGNHCAFWGVNSKSGNGLLSTVICQFERN